MPCSCGESGIAGVTPVPDESFVLPAVRQLTDGVDGVVGLGRVLICDRHPKWSGRSSRSRNRGVRVLRALTKICDRDGKWTDVVHEQLREAGVQIVAPGSSTERTRDNLLG
jgi:hypothetical protein